MDGQRLGPRCCGNAKSPEPSLPPRLEGLEAAFVCRFSRPSMCLLGTQLRFCLFFFKKTRVLCVAKWHYAQERSEAPACELVLQNRRVLDRHSEWRRGPAAHLCGADARRAAGEAAALAEGPARG